ncbi:MAG: TraR/DksA C4-type zinc finger protein [Patescibacteria group bacterium]
MDKKAADELKQKLEQERNAVEEHLKKFATKDEKIAGDWDTRFPKLDAHSIGSSGLETAADEVEEYSTLLPVEHSLEIRLKNINTALEKIEKGGYGKCEKCGKEIPSERLEVSPESRFCLDCGE